jgi:hypothetical protein
MSLPPPNDPNLPKLDEPTKALDAAYNALLKLGHPDLAERVMAVRIDFGDRYPAYSVYPARH